MGLKEGGLATVDWKFPYQQYNRLLTNFHQAGVKTELTDAQPGMIASDADDQRLWHKTGDSFDWDEILQENSSHDAEPIFKALQLQVVEDAVSDPPTDAELDSAIGTPASKGDGWHCFVRDTYSGGKIYLVVAYDDEWWTFTGTLAV